MFFDVRGGEKKGFIRRLIETNKPEHLAPQPSTVPQLNACNNDSGTQYHYRTAIIPSIHREGRPLNIEVIIQYIATI